VARERRKSREYIKQPSCEKEKRGEAKRKRFGGNDASADRGFAPTTQPKQQGVNAL
jgi:hypothetical protein